MSMASEVVPEQVTAAAKEVVAATVINSVASTKKVVRNFRLFIEIFTVTHSHDELLSLSICG
jgi:hypothetical protein